MIHSTQVMQRFQRPRFIQRGRAAAVGSAGSRLAGALIEIHLQTAHSILQVGFRAYGCPATVASADWLAEQMTGSAVGTAPCDRHAIIRALELPVARQHCAALAVEAMAEALKKLDT